LENAADNCRYAAPVCDDVLLDLLCGEHNQFMEWLKTIESVGADPEACNGSLKAKVFNEVRCTACII
jgi:hypothetical protein